MIDSSSERSELTRRAARLLQGGDARRAFRLADRLCRQVSRPDARTYLLRAAAATRLDDVEGAAEDLQSALDEAPCDPAVAEAVLLAPHAPTPLRLLAALTIVQADASTLSATRSALASLFEHDTAVVLRARLVEATLGGWVAWRGPPSLTVHATSTEGATRRVVLGGDPAHSLAADAWRVATLHVPGLGDQLPSLTCGFPDDVAPARHVLALTREASRRPYRPTGSAGTPTQAVRRPCTVILPCYDDAEITARCLGSLARQTTTIPFSVILVNDRPDDGFLRVLLEDAAALHGWTLVTTPYNLGFVGAVERGLAVGDPHRDVLLLNADTLLPDNALERLAVAAYGAGDIGTVTPLSNNGEVTSLPLPFIANPLPDLRTVQRLDAVAAVENAGVVVDLPSGVGFCLYVRRACLDAVGGLPDAYHRGYYEDVDLCLRGRRAGFRSVCAADVFVGHAGSRSFKGEKTSLVARNLGLLRSRFPSFPENSRAFTRRDGLATARHAVVAASARPMALSRLLIARSDDDALQSRATQLRVSGIEVLVLTRVDPVTASRVRLERTGPENAFDCTIDLEDPVARDRLLSFLDRLEVRSAEVLDDPALPEAFLTVLGTRISIRRLIDRAPPFGDTERTDMDRALPFPARVEYASDHALADHPLPMNAMAAAALEARGRTFVARRTAARRAPSTVTRRLGNTLGILYPEAGAASERLLRLLVSRLETTALVVMGRTFADQAYMAHEDVVILGATKPGDHDALIERHRIGALFLPDRHGGTMLLATLGARLDRPTACFDWSGGAARGGKDDLGIDPRLCDSDAVDRLLSWAGRHLRSDVDES